MSELYEQTKQIHELLKKVKAKYNLQENYLENQSDSLIFENGQVLPSNYVTDINSDFKKLFIELKELKACFKLYSKQIRQILACLKDVLGENSEVTKLKNKIENIEFEEKIIGMEQNDFIRLLASKSKKNETCKNVDAGYLLTEEAAELLNIRNSSKEWCQVLFKQKWVYETELQSLPQSKAEALCKKWLDGLKPLFDREPGTVLEELINVLENQIVSEEIIKK